MHRSDRSTLLETPRQPVLPVVLLGMTGLQSESPDYARDLSLGQFRMCFWLSTGVDLPTLYI
jgi:hypothetical protein